MLDHVGFAVVDIDKSRGFYRAALEPLGLSLLVTLPPEQTGGRTVLGFGRGEEAFFWIGDGERVGEGTHVAFRATTRAAVDAFHRAALAAGGADHGAPGIREQYGPTYYAAFVLDPDGINVEAVCHAPE